MELKLTKLPLPDYYSVSFCKKYDLLLGNDRTNFVFWRRYDSEVFRYEPFRSSLSYSALLNDFLYVFREVEGDLLLFPIQQDGSVKTDPVFSCRETFVNVHNIFLSEDNEIFSYGKINQFFVWKTKDWNLVRIFKFQNILLLHAHWRNDGNAIAFICSNRERLNTNSDDAIVAYSDFLNVKVCPYPFKSSSYVNDIYFASPDKIRIIGGNWLYEWDLRSNKVSVFKDLFDYYQYFFLGQNGSLALIPDLRHSSFSIYNLEKKRYITKIKNDPDITGRLLHVFETRDNKYLLYFNKCYIVELDPQNLPGSRKENIIIRI